MTEQTQPSVEGERELATAVKQASEDNATRRFERTMTVVDRVLSRNCVGMQVETVPNPTPGWTDGATVTLNPWGLPSLVDLRGGLDTEALAVWLGINAHEVGHTKYTPPKHSPLKTKLDHLDTSGYPGLVRLENFVEDQRMERLVGARFRPWRTYLSAAAMRLIVEAAASDAQSNRAEVAQQLEFDKIWPSVAGRTWLPIEVRRAAREAWEQAHGQADEVAALIGAYQLLEDPGYEDASDAVSILTRLHKLLRDLIPPEEMPRGCVHGMTSNDVGSAMTAGDMPEIGTADTADLDAAGTPSDLAALNGEADGEGDASGEGEAEADGEDSDTDGEDDADEGAGVGKGPGPKLPASISDIVDTIAQAAARELVADQEVRADLESIAVSIKGRRSTATELESYWDRDSDDFARRRKQTIEADQATRHLAREVSDRLRHLVDETLPQWNRRVDSGKLNVKRYMLREVGDPLDDIFDRFQQGMQDEVSLDVRVAVDISGSMSSRYTHLPQEKNPDGTFKPQPSVAQRAAEATWAIRRAVEHAEGDVTVYGFDYIGYVLVPRGKRTHNELLDVFPAGGGTDPKDVIEEVYRTLPHVEARHKIFVAITDGQWHGDTYGQLMDELRHQGIVTIGVVLNPSLANPAVTGDPKVMKETTEACKAQLEVMGTEYGAYMGDPHGMVPLFERVVGELMLGAINNQAGGRR